MMNFGFMSGWGMVFAWIGGLIVLGLFIWLIVSISGHTTSNQNFLKESPLDILKRRYVRGEISKEEFDKMSTDIRY